MGMINDKKASLEVDLLQNFIVLTERFLAARRWAVGSASYTCQHRSRFGPSAILLLAIEGKKSRQIVE